MSTATFFTPATLAEVYQIPIKTVWQYLRQGEFKGALKMGRVYRIPYEAKAEFEKRHRVNGKNEK